MRTIINENSEASVSHETPQEFMQRHGNGHRPIKIDGVFVLPDGATIRETIDGTNSQLREPPSDKAERYRLQKEYALARASQLRKEFMQSHAEWMEVSQAAISDPLSWEVTEEDYQRLADLKAQCDQWFKWSIVVQEHIDKLPENAAKKAEEEQRAELAMQRMVVHQELHQKIASLHLWGSEENPLTAAQLKVTRPY